MGPFCVILRLLDPEEGLVRRVIDRAVGPHPSEGEGWMCVRRLILSELINIRYDGPVRCLSHVQDLWFLLAFDCDGLSPHDVVRPLPFVHVLVRPPSRILTLVHRIQVLHVSAAVCDSPRNLTVATKDDRRKTNEHGAHGIELWVVLGAVPDGLEMSGQPDGGGHEGQVRVVAQQWLACLGAAPADHPRI